MNATTCSRALEWIVGDDTGVSSKAIWAHMMGTKPESWCFGNHPHDPDDFGRCYRLLCRIPEWRQRIGEMATLGPEWDALSAAWDELEALWEREIGPGVERRYGSAPEICMRMREIIDDARGAT